MSIRMRDRFAEGDQRYLPYDTRLPAESNAHTPQSHRRKGSKVAGEDRGRDFYTEGYAAYPRTKLPKGIRSDEDRNAWHSGWEAAQQDGVRRRTTQRGMEGIRRRNRERYQGAQRNAG